MTLNYTGCEWVQCSEADALRLSSSSRGKRIGATAAAAAASSAAAAAAVETESQAFANLGVHLTQLDVRDNRLLDVPAGKSDYSKRTRLCLRCI
jgi:hypothetical protein